MGELRFLCILGRVRLDLSNPGAGTADWKINLSGAIVQSMDDIETKPVSTNVQAALQSDESDPAYEKWAERKIEAALEADTANPDRRLTQAQMWEKHGLAR